MYVDIVWSSLGWPKTEKTYMHSCIRIEISMPYVCYYIEMYIHTVDGLGNKNGKNCKCVRF
jgi:hypothetical protein